MWRVELCLAQAGSLVLRVSSAVALNSGGGLGFLRKDQRRLPGFRVCVNDTRKAPSAHHKKKGRTETGFSQCPGGPG